MRLNHVHIEHIMGIEVLDLDLSAPMVVLVAGNGGGKTSILKALRVGVGAWLGGIQDKAVTRPQIDDDLLRERIVGGPVEPSLEWTGQALVEVHGAIHGTHQIGWKVWRPDISSRTRFSDAKVLTHLAKAATGPIVGQDRPTLPLLAYYGARRQRDDSPPLDRQGLTRRTEGYVRCLDSSIHTAHLLQRWDKLDRSTHGNDEARDALQALHRAVSGLLPVGDSEVIWSPAFSQPLVRAAADGSWMPFRTLSDGFRNMIEIGMDLGLRALQLNPQLGAKAIEMTPGVVIIDELGQHLHPRWQLGILARLRASFPRVQFVVSTHSPFATLDRTPDTIVYRLREAYGAVDIVPIAIAEEDIGHDLLEVVRGPAFGVPTTLGPRLRAALEERALLLGARARAEDPESIQDDLRMSAERIAALRGQDVTELEDIVRLVVHELGDDLGALLAKNGDAHRALAVAKERAREALLARGLKT